MKEITNILTNILSIFIKYFVLIFSLFISSYTLAPAPVKWFLKYGLGFDVNILENYEELKIFQLKKELELHKIENNELNLENKKLSSELQKNISKYEGYREGLNKIKIENDTSFTWAHYAAAAVGVILIGTLFYVYLSPTDSGSPSMPVDAVINAVNEGIEKIRQVDSEQMETFMKSAKSSTTELRSDINDVNLRLSGILNQLVSYTPKDLVSHTKKDTTSTQVPQVDLD